MADPKVIGWVRKAAQATGADPAALLATSLVESGARTGAVGDNGTSFGPWQMHRGGALGSHSPAWANSYETALNRAQEFKRLQVRGGKGAAAVQRPADPTGYARKVDAQLAEARRLLGSTTPPSRRSTAPQLTTPTSSLLPGLRTSDDADIGQSLIQSILNANAELAGIPQIQMPIPQAQAPLSLPAKPTPAQQAAKTIRPTGRVVDGKFKLIGGPNQGTHTIGNWQSDNATDIAMPVGTPIRAAEDGVIGSRIGSLGSSSPRMAGLRVNLQGSNDAYYYAHLSKLAVKAGQRVKKGQIIGYSGSANGTPHLHLGVQKGDPRKYA